MINDNDNASDNDNHDDSDANNDKYSHTVDDLGGDLVIMVPLVWSGFEISFHP